jgi:hypothetical protein
MFPLYYAVIIYSKVYPFRLYGGKQLNIPYRMGCKLLNFDQKDSLIFFVPRLALYQSLFPIAVPPLHLLHLGKYQSFWELFKIIQAKSFRWCTYCV